MIGKKFGRLTVIEQLETPDGKKGRGAWYLCRCDCGGEKTVRGSSLRKGITASCGCLHKEMTVSRNRKNAEIFNDLSGQRFGRLVAERVLEERKYGQRVWLCRCDCGKYKKAASGHLKNGAVKSCGCLPARQPYDLKGKKFGRLTVEELTEQRKSNGGAVWKCRCECGNYIYASANNLIRKTTASCGCIRREDLSGQRFGNLYVLRLGSRSGTGKGSFWICRCNCGKDCEVHAHKLKSGHTRSCGCLHNEAVSDLSSRRFGKLVVIEDSGERRKGSGGVIWKCRCDCGQEKLIRQDSLVSGRTTSCGCVKSRGNAKIAKLLVLSGIDFIPEYSPKDVNGNYRFDFAVLEQGKPAYFIEYDGIQHFKYTGRGWNTKKQHDYTVACDKIKDDYCKKKGMPLIRIPYTAYNDISVSDLVLTKSRYLHIR